MNQSRKPLDETLTFQKRTPGATYRLQLNREFTFAQATEILEYLRALGITDWSGQRPAD